MSMRMVMTPNPEDAEMNYATLDFSYSIRGEADKWHKIIKSRPGWEVFAEWDTDLVCRVGIRKIAGTAAKAAKGPVYNGKSLADLKTEAGKREIAYTADTTTTDLIALLRAKDEK